MHRSGRHLFTVVLSTLVAFFLSLNMFANVLRADEDEGESQTNTQTTVTDTYTISTYAGYNCITDSAGNVIPGWSYCIDHSKSSPNTNVVYTRVPLSTLGLDSETETMLRSFSYNRDSFVAFIRQMAAAGNYIAETYINAYDGQSSRDSALQYYVWAIMAGALNTNSSEYSNLVTTYGGSSTDPLTDPNSLYNAFLVPLHDFLVANAPSSEYDCWIYMPDDTTHQRILGHIFSSNDPETQLVNTNPVIPTIPVIAWNVTLRIGKAVMDENGNYVTFDPDSQPLFELNLQVLDANGNAVANQDFMITRSTSSGNAWEQVQTDSEGNLVLPMRACELIYLTGQVALDCTYTLTENTSAMPDDYEFTGMMASSTSAVYSANNESVTITYDRNAGAPNMMYAVNTYNPQPVLSAVAPSNTQPTETQPVATQPAQTQPTESAPAETSAASVETQPTETTAPVEAAPVETQPAAPAEVAPVETLPAQTSATETTAPEATPTPAASDDSAVLNASRTDVDANAVDNNDTSVLGADRDGVAETGESVSVELIAGIIMLIMSAVCYYGFRSLRPKIRRPRIHIDV